MGRPLSKKYFGPPTATGTEIKLQFHFGGAGSVNGWIVKQTGSKRFVCTDGTATKECYLVPKATGDLVDGEMSISVKDDAGTVYQVSKITAHRVTLGVPGDGVGEGSTIAWNWSDVTDDGYAEMEEAGDDTVITNVSTDEDDFEADDPAP